VIADPPFSRDVPSPAASRRNAWSAVWPWLFWALWGAWLAVSDLRSDDVQPAVLLLLAGGFVLGFARPRGWWAWGIGLGLWVVAEPLIAATLGLAMADPVHRGAVLAFIPALLGTATGAAIAGMRRAG